MLLTSLLGHLADLASLTGPNSNVVHQNWSIIMRVTHQIYEDMSRPGVNADSSMQLRVSTIKSGATEAITVAQQGQSSSLLLSLPSLIAVLGTQESGQESHSAAHCLSLRQQRLILLVSATQHDREFHS